MAMILIIMGKKVSNIYTYVPTYLWKKFHFVHNVEFFFSVNVVDGEKLHFHKISRLHMGTYYCIAQNGISPTSNKKISLTVHCEWIFID